MLLSDPCRQTELPPVRARHAAALARLEGVPGEALPPLAMPAHSGLDGLLSPVMTSDGPVLVKTYHGGALAPFGFDGAVRAARLAARAGIGPEVISASPVTQTLVTADLRPGFRTAMVTDFLDPDRLAMLMTAKKRLHGCGHVAEDITSRDIFAALRPRATLPLPGTVGMQVEGLRQWVNRIADALEAAGHDKVLLHGENTVSNVLLDDSGTVMLCDFDRAGMGDAYRDLGAMANDLCVDDIDRAQLLEAYLGHTPAPDQMARLKLHAMLDDAIWALWALAGESDPERRGPELYKYACNRVVRFRVALSSCDMARLLREV